jgi:hypothetical protein
MTSQHWENFVPSSSKVSGWYGGTAPSMTYWVYRRGDAFTAVTYRLHVAEAQNGWHHTMGMFTSWGGVKASNAVVKRACRPGFYQMLLHFSNPNPYDGYTYNKIKEDPGFDHALGQNAATNSFDHWSGKAYWQGSPYTGAGSTFWVHSAYDFGGSGRGQPLTFQTGMFYHNGWKPTTSVNSTSQSSHYDTSGKWSTWGNNSFLDGKIRDNMVLRPSLVDPTNCDNHMSLWTPANYDGTQMYYTGFPIADPNIVDGSDYEL